MKDQKRGALVRRVDWLQQLAEELHRRGLELWPIDPVTKARSGGHIHMTREQLGAVVIGLRVYARTLEDSIVASGVV